ncbi:DUF2878 domain-containing protein [Elongatibacter sediminis]|uniref:DUF2878 domain-containing protein n=1 Tax=Elongatibacter sediminis TaxID=3119006 RepID=A0AAW9RMC1_9GAMM
MRIKLLNYGLFQVGWLACVVGAAGGYPQAGVLAVAVIAALHLTLAARASRELAVLAACALLGGAFDSIVLATGWVIYPNGEWIPGAAPYWIIAMWVLFGSTLNLSMGWLRGRPWVSALLGAIGAPLSYLGGARLGAMTLVEPVAAMTLLAVGWAAMLPVLVRLASRLDGFLTDARPAYVLTGWRHG